MADGRSPNTSMPIAQANERTTTNAPVNVTMNAVETISKYLIDRGQSLDDMWLVINGFFVFFMMAGFAFLEAGAVRRQNVMNSLFRNLLDAYICGVTYWLFGFAFAYGNTGNPFIGSDANYFALSGTGTDKYAFWFFQFVFASTASTIVSGGIAERSNSLGYFIISFIISGFVYPVVTHWVWSEDGWLFKGDGKTHFVDYAGSCCVHVVGGTCALVASFITGPRQGRFDERTGKAVDIPGHNLTYYVLGGTILFFGFLAFNGGSQGSISKPGDGERAAQAVTNTVISGTSGGLILTFFVWIVERRWSVIQGVNGVLAGMVAICAGCAFVYPWGAFLTGTFAALVFYGYSRLTPMLKIDDPLDAIALHLGAGSWGVIAVAIFASDGILETMSARAWANLGWQVAGLVTTFAWSVGVVAFICLILKVTGIINVGYTVQSVGQDIEIHGEQAYNEAPLPVKLRTIVEERRTSISVATPQLSQGRPRYPSEGEERVTTKPLPRYTDLPMAPRHALHGHLPPSRLDGFDNEGFVKGNGVPSDLDIRPIV